MIIVVVVVVVTFVVRQVVDASRMRDNVKRFIVKDGKDMKDRALFVNNRVHHCPLGNDSMI